MEGEVREQNFDRVNVSYLKRLFKDGCNWKPHITIFHIQGSQDDVALY